MSKQADELRHLINLYLSSAKEKRFHELKHLYLKIHNLYHQLKDSEKSEFSPYMEKIRSHIGIQSTEKRQPEIIQHKFHITKDTVLITLIILALISLIIVDVVNTKEQAEVSAELKPFILATTQEPLRRDLTAELKSLQKVGTIHIPPFDGQYEPDIHAFDNNIQYTYIIDTDGTIYKDATYELPNASLAVANIYFYLAHRTSSQDDAVLNKWIGEYWNSCSKSIMDQYRILDHCAALQMTRQQCTEYINTSQYKRSDVWSSDCYSLLSPVIEAAKITRNQDFLQLLPTIATTLYYYPSRVVSTSYTDLQIMPLLASIQQAGIPVIILEKDKQDFLYSTLKLFNQSPIIDNPKICTIGIALEGSRSLFQRPEQIQTVDQSFINILPIMDITIRDDQMGIMQLMKCMEYLRMFKANTQASIQHEKLSLLIQQKYYYPFKGKVTRNLFSASLQKDLQEPMIATQNVFITSYYEYVQ